MKQRQGSTGRQQGRGEIRHGRVGAVKGRLVHNRHQQADRREAGQGSARENGQNAEDGGEAATPFRLWRAAVALVMVFSP
ncbi:MAG: hypothetical protein IT318_03025 [Anaerolineales bacterium]|nr:hypothetical protein [Anaerolineales bacterium]